MKKSSIIISLTLVLTMIISCFTGWPIYSVSAAENETKVYFEVPTLESWGTTKSVYCHMYNVYGGTPLKNTTFQSNAERCKKDKGTGLYYFDTTNLGTIEEGADYALVFSTIDTEKGSHQTCNITFGKDCLGDTVYVTGEMIENAEDSSKFDFEGAWRNNSDEFGAMAVITSTGKIVGKYFPVFQPRKQIVAQFLASWAVLNTNVITSEKVVGICTELRVNPPDVLEQYKTDYAAQLADPENNPSIAFVETVAALLGVDSELNVKSMRTVGNGDGNWLNNVSWDPAADDNLMKEVAPKVYEITYTNLDVFDNYQVKFAANGSLEANWGGVYKGSGVESEAVYNSNDNITIVVPYELADVTLRLDLSNFDYATKTGATFTVTVVGHHDHVFTDIWEKNDTYHWHKCQFENCTKIKDQAYHSFKPATCTSKAICDYCGEEYGDFDSSNHNLEKIPAKAETVTQNGNIEYWHCKDCGKYFADKNGTNEIKLADTVIASNAWEETVLRLQASASKTSIKLKWNAVPDADGYVIYWNKCGTKNGFKQVKVIENGKTLTWTHKNRKKNTWNKYYVKAYKLVDGKKSFIKTSNRIHLVTKGGKYTNVKKLKSNVSSVSLNKDKTKALKITQIYVEKNKTLVKHMRPLTYTSSDKAVATVTSKGVIKAKGTGNCYIYVTAHNGVYTKVKETVK